MDWIEKAAREIVETVDIGDKYIEDFRAIIERHAPKFDDLTREKDKAYHAGVQDGRNSGL